MRTDASPPPAVAFVAPRSTVQVIVACLFAFGMVLLTIHIKPYRERANNQLVALSQINIHLFLFVGLLLQTSACACAAGVCSALKLLLTRPARVAHASRQTRTASRAIACCLA